MIYITRHGQTDWNTTHQIQGKTDIPLNDCGRKQALLLSSQIPGLHLDRIITSDLKRAQETAKLLNYQTRLPIISDKRLREIDFGDLEGHAIPELTPEIWKALAAQQAPFHAESLPHAFKRVCSLFAELRDDKNTLLVTHSGLLKVISYYIGHPHQFNYPLFRSNFLYVSMPNATIFQRVKQHNQMMLKRIVDDLSAKQQT